MKENIWQALLKPPKQILVMLYRAILQSKIAKSSKKQSLLPHVCDQRPPYATLLLLYF